jgi:hypothetical protein
MFQVRDDRAGKDVRARSTTAVSTRLVLSASEMIDREAGGSVDRPQEGFHRAQERFGLFDARLVARVFKDPSLAAGAPADEGYRLLDETSAIRATRSFFTSVFGRGLSTGKWSDPFVPENPFVAVASAGITDPLCGK